MSDFTFDPASTDPGQADAEALAILKRLERNKQAAELLAGVPDATPESEPVKAVTTEKAALLGQLASYKEFKVKRGEPMFSNVEEAKARNSSRGAEKQVSGILALMQSDDKTFNTLLKERGQVEEFALLESLMPEGVSAKAEFLKNEGMKELGFSDREISSGFADPMARQMVGAGVTEPTGEAILRWGLDKKNQFDRRKKVSEAAFQVATEQFLGMGSSDDAFEKELATASPDLSDEERVHARAVRNQVFAGMEKKFPGLQMMVKKGFNTIASEEGTGTKFGGEVYANTDEFIDDLVKNTKPEDFATVVAMFAATAQAHGQDVDGVMNSFARKWERGIVGLGENFTATMARLELKNIEQGMDSQGDSNEATKIQDVETGVLYDKKQFAAYRKGKEGREVTASQIRKKLDYAGQIRNWRDATAKIRSDNWFIDGWVYGTAGSLPEMAAAFLPGGIPFVAAAQAERNMADLRMKHPDVDPAKFEKGSMIAGGIYAALNKIGVEALFSKTPMFKNKLAEYTGLLAFETAVEFGQDGSAPAVMKVYELADKEMPGINLFGEGGELTELIKQSPQTAWSMMPMIFLSVGGKAAVEFMDAKQLKTLLNDVNYLGQYGLSSEEAAKVKAMPLMEAADYIKNWGLPTTTNDGGTTTFEFGEKPVTSGIVVAANSDNTFSVSNETTTLTARSPAEVAEVARQLAPQQFTPPTVDRTIRFGDPEVETVNSFFGAMFTGVASNLTKEDPFRVKEGLPPVNDPNVNEGQQSYGAKLRYGLQGFFSSRTIPSKSLDKIRVVAERKAAGVENQFNQIALALDNRINRAVAALPRATQDAAAVQMRQDAYLALRGDAKALLALPAKVRTVVETGRTSIDAYSNVLASSNALSDELATTVGDNIGTYVTRQFRAFDPDAKWNYATVKKQHPVVFQTALAEIMAGGLSATEADGVLRVMLDPARSQNFYAGTGKVGKVNVSNLIKRKDLSPAILDVMGEIRNPAINIRETGKAVSKIVIVNNAQNAMADWLVANGLASRKPDTQKRLTERLGAESYSYAGVDPITGDPITGHGVRTSRAFSGFGEIYLEPELHAALTNVFEGGKKQDSKFLTAFNHLAKVTAVGKFAQVILNPAAYPTNFLGGVATEIFNGRLSSDGVAAYGKFGSLRNVTKGSADPYGVTEQMAFYSMSGSAWLAAGGVGSMNRNQLATEMEQKGIRDASVFGRDLSDTLDVAFGEKVAKVGRVLSKAYQATDNAVKRNAFIIELDKWARANPNETMDVLVQRAAEDVRATTQNYDMVPSLLRQFSQRGVIVPTYISFAYELVRNTIGTAKLATKEIASGNPVLVAAGMKRVAGMATVGALLYALNTGISSVLAGLDDEEREALKAAMPPWLEDSEVVFLQADDKQLRYFDPSYLIPHQMFYNAAAAAVHAAKKGDAAGAVIDPTTTILGSFGELNIFNATVAEAITNKKRGGGQIYNPEEPDQVKKSTDIAKHFGDSMFLPGFMRTINKVKKAEEHEVGFAGSTASMDDVWLGAFGIRPYTLDTSSEKFLVDNLVKFNSRTRDISGTMSERRRSTMTPGELAKGEAKLATMRANLSAEVNATIRMFKQLGISDERIKGALKAAKTPKNLDIDFRKKTSTPEE